MKYKNYELPQNPSKIEIFSDTNVKAASVFDGNSVVENISVCPIRVRCSGELFGSEGRRCRDRLQYLLRQKSSGWLFAPELSPIRAYLTSLVCTKGTDKNSISYVIEFTEHCDGSKGMAQIEYTTCHSGENAFDIAGRCSVPVERIVRLNSLASPFDIDEGDRVMLI